MKLICVCMSKARDYGLISFTTSFEYICKINFPNVGI